MTLPADLMVDDLDLPFWEACGRHEFLVHRCGVCGRSYWPATCCVEHGGADMSWAPALGTGVVHTFTVYHQVYVPELADQVPYVVAVVALDEGPFFHTSLVDCPPDSVKIGMPVEVAYDDVADGVAIPRFRPSG